MSIQPFVISPRSRIFTAQDVASPIEDRSGSAELGLQTNDPVETAIQQEEAFPSMVLVLEQAKSKTRTRAQPLAIASPRRFYRPELDMLRFFAFLAVFMHHGIFNFSPTTAKWGGFGLSLFFFLSAFLITELLQREKTASETISIPDFYLRRALRIWPLYFGFLLFALCLSRIIPQYHQPPLFYAAYTFMAANIYLAHIGLATTPLLPLWSISVEEQFYLFWPLLNRWCTRFAMTALAIASLPIGALAILWLTAHHASSNIGIWFSSLVQFQFFGCGALISLRLRGRIPTWSLLTRLFLLVSGLGFWGIAARWSGILDLGTRPAAGPILGYLLVAGGCTAVFCSVYGLNPQAIPKVLIYSGKISFGLYVFHQLGLDLASRIVNGVQWTRTDTHHIAYGICHLTLGLALTFPLAALSYTFYERPFLQWKDRFAIIHSRTS